MADPSLQRERKLSTPGAALFVFAAISGFAFYLTSTHGVTRQWMLLLHILTGSSFLLIMLPYVPVHFLRTAYFRRPSLIVTGLLLFAVLLAVGWTGGMLAYVGHQESTSWVVLTHLFSGCVLVLLLTLHLLDHVYRMPRQRKQQYPDRFLSFLPRPAGFALLVSIIIIGSLLVLNAERELVPATAATEAYGEVYEEAYGEHPFHPSQTETAHGGFVAEAEIAQSENCASCHADIARQWSSSMHRQAASDPAYVTNINLLESTKGIAAARYCEGCHAPVALLTGELSEGGEHGGVAGTVAHREGVSCMSCHGVQNMVHLKGVASYEFTPRHPYIFDDATNDFGRLVNELVIRADPAQHKQDLGADLLQDPALCAGCHAQFMDKDMNGWGWVKMQDEYSAWLAGPFSGHESEFAAGTTMRCQDCHMPKVKSDDPSADANGMVASHHFPGGNTVIPLLAGDQEQYQATVAMLQNNGLRLTINRPNRADAQQNLRPLDEQIRGGSEAPYYVYLNEDVRLDVIVANQAVGHDFPAGTIDLGEAWIEFSVMDAEGDVVFSSGNSALGEPLPAGTHVYKSIPVDRQGREVWRHDLFNMVGETFRRVIPAGQADLANFSFTVPGWAKTPLSVSATLKYRKLNERYAEFALGDQYIPIPIIDIAWDSLEIPVRTRIEVDQSD